MRKFIVALVVAVFAAPAFAGDKKDELPVFVKMAFQKHFQNWKQLKLADGSKVTRLEQLVRTASGREAGFSGNISGHTVNRSLPVTLFTDSDEYVKLSLMFGRGETDDALAILASNVIHELCHTEAIGGSTTDELTCYSYQVSFLQNEARTRPSPILELVIQTHTAHLAQCQRGELPGCGVQVSAVGTAAGTPAPRR